MKLVRKIIFYVLLMCIVNVVLIINVLQAALPINILIIIAMSILYIAFNIWPTFKKMPSKKLKVLIDGHALIVDAVVIFFLEVCIYLTVILYFKPDLSIAVLILYAIVAMALDFVLFLNGAIRIMLLSKQLGITKRVLLFMTWWIPFVNLIVIWIVCRTVRRECMFELAKFELNNNRKENEICKTKYPLLMVHGIFWRDWQMFNYWGRITGELIRNGATIYYGNHHSAAPMEVGALELKNQILEIIAKENCEKVNIIAHSKGGLDARYAISCLGMDSYVGSLTAIGSPHRGCELIDLLFSKLSAKMISSIARRYNAMYKKLGDEKPDFIGGVSDLTTEKCAEFNNIVQDKEGVLYQSATSKMNSFFSAGFPLNAGYALFRLLKIESDGFTSIDSSKWGDFLGCFETKRIRGVSHGDTIDLMRENIHGFDVCEFYIKIVSDLKGRDL